MRELTPDIAAIARLDLTGVIVTAPGDGCYDFVSRYFALMAEVPEQALTVLEGEDALTLYQWNTHRAKHYFCRRCGIYVFHTQIGRDRAMHEQQL